jgi:hypothetical protein
MNNRMMDNVQKCDNHTAGMLLIYVKHFCAFEFKLKAGLWCLLSSNLNLLCNNKNGIFFRIMLPMTAFITYMEIMCYCDKVFRKLFFFSFSVGREGWAYGSSTQQLLYNLVTI